jgi:hypothetical protein
MVYGQQVTLAAFGGKNIVRTVVKDLGDVLLICKPEEFAAAEAESREPISVGFPKSAVVDIQ